MRSCWFSSVLTTCLFQEMLKDDSKLRHGPKSSYHDRVFEEEIIDLINITKGHYEAYVSCVVVPRYLECLTCSTHTAPPSKMP